MSARQLLHARRSLALARHALIGTKSVESTPSVFAHIEEVQFYGYTLRYALTLSYTFVIV